MSLAIHTTMLLRIFCFSSTQQLRCTSRNEAQIDLIHNSLIDTLPTTKPCKTRG